LYIWPDDVGFPWKAGPYQDATAYVDVGRASWRTVEQDQRKSRGTINRGTHRILRDADCATEDDLLCRRKLFPAVIHLIHYNIYLLRSSSITISPSLSLT
jgi:hypothetical protein